MSQFGKTAPDVLQLATKAYNLVSNTDLGTSLSHVQSAVDAVSPPHPRDMNGQYLKARMSICSLTKSLDADLSLCTVLLLCWVPELLRLHGVCDQLLPVLLTR